MRKVVVLLCLLAGCASRTGRPGAEPPVEGGAGGDAPPGEGPVLDAARPDAPSARAEAAPPDAEDRPAAADAGLDAAAGAPGGDAGGRAVATVSVDVEHPGKAVPADFAGLSVEWSQVLSFLGDGK